MFSDTKREVSACDVIFVAMIEYDMLHEKGSITKRSYRNESSSFFDEFCECFISYLCGNVNGRDYFSVFCRQVKRLNAITRKPVCFCILRGFYPQHPSNNRTCSPCRVVYL